jgi:hypothetical protein
MGMVRRHRLHTRAMAILTTILIPLALEFHTISCRSLFNSVAMGPSGLIHLGRRLIGARVDHSRK